MNKKHTETFITLIIGLLITIIAAFIIHRIEDGRSEKQIVDNWSSKWEECQTNPVTRIEIVKKEISFECPKDGAVLIKDCQVGSCLEPINP